MIDSLNQETAWEVVYIPIFDTPLEMLKNDTILVSCKRTLSEDKIHPNYEFEVKAYSGIKMKGQSSFISYYKSKIFGSKKIYKKLFKK